MQMLHFRVPTSCNGMRLNIFLRTMGVSSACIKAVKYQGTGFCVRLGDEVIPVHTDYRVATAQIVSFSLPPEPPTAVQPEPLPIDVIYEDEFAAVLNKPAGIAVHPTLNHTSGTLANGWLYRLKCRGEDGVFRPVNRIDKNTSGLVLCAQNAFAAPELAKTAQKCYLALVEGPLPVGSGRIDVPIARRGDSIIGRCVREDGKPSVTEYTVLAVCTAAIRISLRVTPCIVQCCGSTAPRTMSPAGCRALCRRIFWPPAAQPICQTKKRFKQRYNPCCPALSSTNCLHCTL